MRRGLLLLAILPFASPAHAGSEDFSTFSVYTQQEDDESLLDRVLTRPTHEREREWERVPQGLTTSQGCLTSGTWVIDTRLKARAPIGRRASFGLDVRDQESDRFAVQYFDFSFRFPGRFGTPGFVFRPLFDKSRQDLGVFWEAGEETASAVARVTFTFEDTFNNFWAFRQSRVGNDSEPYERHPYEPAFWVRVRHPGFGYEAGGQWLTASRIRFDSESGAGPTPRATLWGALGFASVEAAVAGFELEASGENRQALSRATLKGSLDYGGDFRRQWLIETVARRAFGGATVDGPARAARALSAGKAPAADRRRAFGGATVAEARWIYQEATERSDPPYASRRLATVDRLLQLEARRGFGNWSLRAGVLHDRITVGESGDPLQGFDTRIESRGFFGLGLRMGSATLDVVEGFELDPEPYDVWGVHDKAFLHFQTRF